MGVNEESDVDRLVDALLNMTSIALDTSYPRRFADIFTILEGIKDLPMQQNRREKIIFLIEHKESL